MPHSTTPWLAAAICAGLLLSGCTDSEPPAPQTTPTPPSSEPSPTQRELSAEQRATQLTALAPSDFDAMYRLDSKGKRPDANVRMRASKEKFRLDVQQGRSTAVLFTNKRGVISCQIESPLEKNKKEQRKQKSCFLVAKEPRGIPELFDPQVQRLFRSVTDRLARTRNDLKVRRTDNWRAPNGLGPAECFAVRGPNVTPGTYCYLATPGPRIGLLARVEFPSGNLSIRQVKRAVNDDVFQPPASPTPLPNQE